MCLNYYKIIQFKHQLGLRSVDSSVPPGEVREQMGVSVFHCKFWKTQEKKQTVTAVSLLILGIRSHFLRGYFGVAGNF